MKHLIRVTLILCFQAVAHAQPKTNHNLFQKQLPVVWDEGHHIGNGMLGALVWYHNKNLRFSLDRADLWDERPAVNFKNITYPWVYQQVINNNYNVVQKFGDLPYEEIPYPTKIPGAALEFPINSDANISTDLITATTNIEWQNETRLQVFVHATQQIGVFRFQNLKQPIIPELIPPIYKNNEVGKVGNSVEGQSLQRLGYEQGNIKRTSNSISYVQKGSLGFKYQVQVNWIQNGDELFGVWNISSSAEKKSDAHKICMAAINSGFDNLYNTHKNWWKEFWSRSSVTLPEKDLEKQYYQEIYKLGSTARKDAPPISLQAIWTADNGKLPPWKGDFHHDLNTQLSYWPAYTSNHLDLSETFTDWLWKVRAENKKYTKAFFQVPGLNVPGVTTISGKPMGGWIQYSFSPSVSCWLAQHFYWQWKYSGSQTFLTNQAYPYLKEVATFIENITIVKDGKRNLLLSSSPEYFDNSIKAWFLNFTNYDLSLMRNALSMTIEAAQKLNYKTEAAHWNEVLSTLPELDINETGLTIAPGQNLDESHRHIAQLMALHPLGTLNPDTEANKMIIENSLRRLEQMGTDWWTGYSFSWAACLYARAGKGEEAVRQLNIFQKNFCLPNTFHANGDQHGGQYSKFTYRPFTLEGNLAYAQGIHELLIQSHQGYIKLFPAIPETWNNLSFENLRTEGAFLVSAEMKDGKIIRIKIESTTNAELNIILPSIMINSANQKTITGKYSRFMRAGEILLFEDF